MIIIIMKFFLSNLIFIYDRQQILIKNKMTDFNNFNLILVFKINNLIFCNYSS